MVSSSTIGRGQRMESAGSSARSERLTQGMPELSSSAATAANRSGWRGREDHAQLRIGFEQARPGFEQRGLFAFECAARHDQPQTGGQTFNCA